MTEAREPKLTLGRTYRDKVTGFTGVATSSHRYLNGCVRYCLEAPNTHNGSILDIHFDEERLVEVEAKAGQEQVEPGETGGARPAPPRVGGRA